MESFDFTQFSAAAQKRIKGKYLETLEERALGEAVELAERHVRRPEPL